MAWLIRIFFIIAAPIAALLVARDTLQFDIVQTFVAIILMTALVGIGAAWSGYHPRSRRP
jgi:disulfide bond formation protein DsbB